MLDRMDANEFSEWQAFFRLERWDFDKTPYPWTDEELWAITHDPEDLSRQIDSLIFGKN